MRKIFFLVLLLPVFAFAQNDSATWYRNEPGFGKKINRLVVNRAIVVPNLATAYDSANGSFYYNTSLNKWRFRENGAWTGFDLVTGGATNPAGNYGNVQINRNGIFSTPASDSLSYSSSALNIKGGLVLTGAYGFSDFPAGSISTSSGYGTLIHAKHGSSNKWTLRDESGNLLMYTLAGQTSISIPGGVWMLGGKMYLNANYNDYMEQTANGLMKHYIGNSLVMTVKSTGVETIDEAFGSSWDGKTEVPTKNAIYDHLFGAAVNGDYTPSLTNTTNVAASTAYSTGWYRVGNRVTVYGKVDIDPTAQGAVELRMSLPSLSQANFTQDYQAGGTFSCGPNGESGSINAVSGAGTVALKYSASITTNSSFFFQFTFTWLPA